MKPILIIGGTGTVGRVVVKELVGAGCPVRVLVRDETRARSTLGGVDVDYTPGDLSDSSSIARAARGCEQMFLLTSDGPHQVAQAGDAAKAGVRNGVTHIVKLSSISTGPEAPYVWARAHYAVEQIIEGLGVEYSYLRPHWFMQNLLGAIRDDGGNLVLEFPMADGRVSAIDARDVAACAARLLADHHVLGGATILTGGASFTMEEAAAEISGASGLTVRYRDVAPDAYDSDLSSRGVDREIVDSISTMYEWGRTGKLDRIADGVESITGRKPRTLQEFAQEVAAPVLRERVS